jgi:hypothetical protein
MNEKAVSQNDITKTRRETQLYRFQSIEYITHGFSNIKHLSNVMVNNVAGLLIMTGRI